MKRVEIKAVVSVLVETDSDEEALQMARRILWDGPVIGPDFLSGWNEESGGPRVEEFYLSEDDVSPLVEESEYEDDDCDD